MRNLADGGVDIIDGTTMDIYRFFHRAAAPGTNGRTDYMTLRAVILEQGLSIHLTVARVLLRPTPRQAKHCCQHLGDTKRVPQPCVNSTRGIADSTSGEVCRFMVRHKLPAPYNQSASMIPTPIR